MEDQSKIDAILAVLNEGLAEPQWFAADGFHSYMTATVQGPNKVSFQLGNGVVAKLFVNQATGELKTYFYKSVLRDEGAGNA